MDHLRHILTESAHHTVTMIPFLFLVFLLVESLSHSTKGNWIRLITRHSFLGPVGAAILGLFPQCGFSIIATTMYVERLIPMGSLIAAYIATSDEAVPIMISNLGTAKWVVPLLGTKLVFGACAGIAINLGLLAMPNRRSIASEPRKPAQSMERTHNHGHVDSHLAEGCFTQCVGQKANLLTLMSHALSRTTRIAAMVFVISTFLNLAGHLLEHKFIEFLTASGPLQILSASIIGLVPSCATSVALAEGFSNGFLTFPALLSGLTSNSGMGIMVLIKECRNKAEVLSIVFLLVAFGFLAGLLTSLLM